MGARQLANGVGMPALIVVHGLRFDQRPVARRDNASLTGDVRVRLSSDYQFLGPSTRARVLSFLIGHSWDIYGQMVVYLRLNGAVPPASQRP